MKKKTVFFIVLFFVLLSVFVYVLFMRIKSKKAPAEPETAFNPETAVERILETAPAEAASVQPGSTEASVPSAEADGESKTVEETVHISNAAFTLEILGKTVPVARGVDEKTLDASPGWLTTSAYPGTEGICIIYGHRNRNHLKVLKDIGYGDRITCILPSGEQFTYVVESMDILDSESELRIPLINGEHMLLMTCYPFYYTGHAPQKFVCILRKEV